MAPLDLFTTLILWSAVFYTVASVYVIAGVLRPLLAAAIKGLIELARLSGGAVGRG